MKETIHPQQTGKISEEEFDRNFKPKGAMAFFVLLVILGLVIWYGIYFLMLERM
jgi:cytochrome c oxidase subunit IIa family protein